MMEFILMVLMGIFVATANVFLIGMIDELFLDDKLSTVVKKWLDKKFGGEE